MSEKEEKERILLRILEDRSLIVALVIIVPFIVLTFLIILFLRDIETFKDVSAIYAGWIGISLGYFFGSKQVDVLIQKIGDIIRISEDRIKELEFEKKKYEENNLELQREKNQLEIARERLTADTAAAIQAINDAKKWIEEFKKTYLEGEG